MIINRTSYNHTYIKQRKLANFVIPCIGSNLLKHAEGKYTDGKIKGI